MKKLFLHIGLGKTGSSALQSWLSLNAEALAQQGIDYADLVPGAKHGEVSSGNGFILHQACVGLDFEEVEQLLTATYFTPQNNVAIISCELLQGLRQSSIEKIREICDRNNIDVNVIAYVRSVYEQSYSTYIQGVKRASITHSFGERSSDISFSASVEYLKRYLEVFGDRFIVRNYDEAKKDLYGSFSEIAGINRGKLKTLKLRVNRSLTLKEADVLRRVNALHHGAFSTQLSDFVIGLSPDLKTPVLYDEALVLQVRKDTEEDLRWINEQFKLAPPLLSDYYPGQENASTEPPNRSSYQPVLQWALAYQPSEALQAEFASFLKEFAVFMVEFSTQDALALIKRGHGVQQELAARAGEDVEEEDDRQREPSRPRYLMTYSQDYDLPDEERDPQFAANFYAWVDLITEQAVGSTINPLEHTRVLSSRDSVANGGKASLSGFSIIEADDMDAALSLAKKCPLLDIGGTVEVSHIVQLYQV